MKIVETKIEKLKRYRAAYLSSLPEFQELFIELMIKDSHYYFLMVNDNEIGYVIKTIDGVLIEFYIEDKHIPSSTKYFGQIIKELSITNIYCKSFDGLLLSNCMLHHFSYDLLGVLYRDYFKVLISRNLQNEMRKADLSSVKLILRQDDSIKELFETEDQLIDFIQNENVFEFYRGDEFVGCGMVLKTNIDWDYCDLGVWVNPLYRGNGIGTQIILSLREFAINNKMKPSCGCAVDNIASQKTIEKSGFISKHKLINFITK